MLAQGWERYGGVMAPGAHLRWQHRPDADGPVLIVAFEGWNDAGSAATTALAHAEDLWDAEPFCDVDPEEFFDFSVTRPTVHFDDEGVRQLEWPSNQFSWARVNDDLEVVTLLGVEPQLRWRTFCEQVTSVATDLDASMVVMLGALLAEVPHTRPTPVYGTAHNSDLAESLSLSPSTYEGPTGIVGTLHHALAAAGIPSVSLWAAVPTYVPNAPSPKAALALVARLGALLDVALPADELSVAAGEYESRIDEVLSDDEDSQEWVLQLEADYDERDLEERGGAELVEEVERFLRNQS
jgi:proteasome assembly chaperone (PAC2) family protein